MENIKISVNTPLMLGVKETAERFGIAQHYARQLALSGKVKAVRVGRGKILINVQSVADSVIEKESINKWIVIIGVVVLVMIVGVVILVNKKKK